MKVEQVKTDSLIPHATNNLRHPDEQVTRIASSIQQFGFNVPVCISKDNVIIAGHGRWLAAKKLGMEKVPAIRADHLTPAQERAWRVIDNKLARDGEWDIENLTLEFDVLKEDGLDFGAWGLDSLLPPEPAPVIPREFDESVADGVTLEATFKVKIPADDSDSFEQRLDELLREFPTATKEKKL